MLGWLWDMLSYLLEVLGLVERQVEEEQGVRWPLNYSSSAFTPPPPSPHPPPRVTVKAVSGQSLSLTLLEGWTGVVLWPVVTLP